MKSLPPAPKTEKTNEIKNTFKRMGIGNNIKEKRSRKGLSQELLAERLHISQATLSNIEANKSVPDIRLLQLIANELDTTLNELIEGNPVMMVSDKNQQGVIGYAEVINNLFNKLIELYEMQLNKKNNEIEELKRKLQERKI